MAEEQQQADQQATDPTTAQAQPQTVEELLAAIREDQRQQHEAIAQMRQEIAAKAVPQPQSSSTPQSAEELMQQRMDEISQFPYYCPACGALYKRERECIGLRADMPHPPVEVVSTDELSGDSANHTPAPVHA